MESDARWLWDVNRGYDAGLLIQSRIPLEVRPKWAADLLELIASRVGVTDPIIDRVIRLANDPTKWNIAHDVFSEVRDVSLKRHLGRLRAERVDLHSGLLTIAELVAKLSYNATLPDDEFDEDSAAWVVACARGFVEVLNDSFFSQDVWARVSYDTA